MAPFLRRRVADRRQPAAQTDNTGKTFTATYGGTPTIGQWAHLVGVYDASTNQITLYVIGRQVDTKASAAPRGTPLAPSRSAAASHWAPTANTPQRDQRHPPLQHRTAPADAAATGDNPTISQVD
ncbi:LamG-like jellyroll fold domain-containing protein [Streptomyces mirabilis]|uniref:LamG-like jellyroll fold domain-containing protein n=1 Tax=Streptomyces mirabilis TaxID=68239 RepID=UPI00364FC3E0